MNKKRVIYFAVAAILFLAASCTGFFFGGVPRMDLASAVPDTFVMKEESGTRIEEYGMYSRKGNDIYLYDGVANLKHKVEDADARTFEPLSCPYARDKYRVYFSDQIIEGADPLTIKTFGSCYGVIFYVYDDKSVFFEGQKMDGADPGTFEILEADYARDKSHVYFQGKIVEGADPKTIVVLVGPHKRFVYAKDSRAVYSQGIEIPDSIGSSFDLGSGKLNEQIFYSDAHDAKSLYWGSYRTSDLITALIIEKGQVPKGVIHIGSFVEYKGDLYCLSNAMGDSYGVPIQGIDVDEFLETAEYLGGDYLKDSKNVYYGCASLGGADPETFQVISLEQHLSRDKNNKWSFNVLMDVDE